jgi:prevent-host-death family protein
MLTRNRQPKKPAQPGAWKLQDAKARFSEVVRRAQKEGPQRVTVHGRDAVVVLAASEYEKISPRKDDGLTGEVLIEMMQEARRLGLRFKPLQNYPKMRPPMKFPADRS